MTGLVDVRIVVGIQGLPALTQIRADLKKHRGTHVEVTGAFITDMEHGWNEIHPITSLGLDT